jgi:uncharacterized damage-inducible protein DinB
MTTAISAVPAPIQEDPRYPIGDFDAAAVTSTRAEQIETLRQLPALLRQAIQGLSDAQLDTPYRDGGWTVRQLVHHVADSHANAYIRFKLAMTEENPTIKPYDEAAWAALADSRLPVEPSLAIIAGVHARLVALLKSLSDEDFERTFRHPERGPMTLAGNLALYDWHSRHHLAHITALRRRMGW